MQNKINSNNENAFKSNGVILGKPKGWLIIDSYNNKFFNSDIIQYDNMTFNTGKLKTELHKKYGGNIRDLFMPWHWTMDIVNEQPFVIQTRPPMYKSLIPGFERWNVICIIGDSENDIYSGKYYKQMAHNIMNPWNYIPGTKVAKTNIEFMTGKNFDRNKLLKELI